MFMGGWVLVGFVVGFGFCGVGWLSLFFFF